MNDNEDPRHDPEGALLKIKALQRNGDLIVADDADDEAREFARIINAKRAEVREIYASQEAAKKAAGRYTLEEAANTLEAGAGERADVMLQKLMTASEAGTLLTFEPGHNARMDYGTGPGRSSRVRHFYEEVFWDGLNQWLDTHERRVAFRFPNPAPDPESLPRDVLVPWEQVAGYLAAELIPDNEVNRAKAVEAYSRTHPGKLSPLLDGQEDERAYLAVMRTTEANRFATAIEIMISNGALGLFTPGTNLPTNERAGALVSTAQILQHMREGRHLSAVVSSPGSVADAHAEETAEERQARRYQICVDAGLSMPESDYAPLPRGIGKLAAQEGITRQSFAEDLKAHCRRLFERQANRR